MEYNKFLTYKEYKKEFYDIFSRIVIGSELSYDKYIKNTMEYKTTFKIYKLFLSRLKELLNLLGITDSLDISILCTYFLIPDGILSITDNFAKKVENYSNCEFVNLIGSKVLTGSAVCRHISKFIVDLNRINKNESYFVVLKNLENDSMDHVVVGLKVEDKKFIIDPLNKQIGISNKDLVTCFNPMGGSIPVNYKIDRVRYKQIIDKLNYLDINVFFELEKLKNLNIFKERYEFVRIKYLYFKELFNNFKTDNYDLYVNITNKLGLLTGYEYNKKIKKLVI